VERAAPEVSVAPVALSFEQLLVKALPHLLLAQVGDLAFSILQKFPVLVTYAVQSQSLSNVKQLHEMYEKSVKTSTLRVLHEHGIIISGQLFPDLIAILVGFRGLEPIVLKKLAQHEVLGYELVCGKKSELLCEFLCHFDLFQAASPHTSPTQPALRVDSEPAVAAAASTTDMGDVLAPFTGRTVSRTPLKHRNQSLVNVMPSATVASPLKFRSSVHVNSQLYNWALMGHHVCSIDVFPVAFQTSYAEQLLIQMHEALNCLHQAGLAHLDVKPANIFLDRSRNFVLGDFGCVREIGEPVSVSTQQFVPVDRFASTASADYDLWMLATTVYDMLLAPDIRIGRDTTRRPRQDTVINVLQTHISSEEALKIVHKIKNTKTHTT
jgi:hypothetical protein